VRTVVRIFGPQIIPLLVRRSAVRILYHANKIINVFTKHFL